VLEFLAAFGRPLSAETLTALTAQAPEQVAGAINALVERQVLEKTVHRGAIQVAYRRAGDERAAYEALGRSERQGIHAAIGYHLQGDPQDLEAYADHLLLGGCGDDAIEAAERAAEPLEITFCYESAADLYERALALSPRQETTERLIRALYALLENTAQFDRAIEVAEQLIEITPDDPEAELKLARLHLRRGNLKTARRHIENLGKRAAIRDDAILWARVLAERADADYLAGQTETGRQAAQEGIALLASTDSAVTTHLGLQNTLGKIALDAGDLDEARSLFSANLERAEAMGLIAEAARARIHLGWIALNASAYDEAQKHYEIGHDLAAQAGEYRYVGGCLQHMGVVAERQRDYATAIRRYQQAVESWKKVGHRSYLAWVGLDLAKLYLDLGAIGRAEAMVKLADKLADAEPPLATRINLEILRGRLAKTGCRFSEAADHFRRAEHLAQDAQQTDRANRARLELAALDIDRDNHPRPAGHTAAAGHTGAAGRIAKVLASAPRGSLRLRALLLSASLAVRDTPDVARTRWFDALDLAHDLQDHEAAWETHYHLAMLARREGRENEARRRLLDAAHLEAKVRATVPKDLRGTLEEQPLRVALRAAIQADTTIVAPTQAPTPSRPRPDKAEPDDGIIGSHPRLLQVLSQIEKVAATDATVLIRGESGTGKELVANAIHDHSDRANKPLIKVNCAALVENLLLSELFGHERGAFTGATQRKAGRFELADGGTIFLDEIGDISPKTQVALLRVLQERRFERVGGTTSLEVDVRLIFATNRDLKRMVDEGKFREDLYYRLRGVQIDLPPLRDRTSDILALANHFFARIANERGTPPKGLDASALKILSDHPWPGNIRELENVLRSVSLFANGPLLGVLDFADYPEFTEVRTPQATTAGTTSIYGDLRHQGLSLRDYKKHIETLCIQDALAESDGNITHAADLLGMKRPRLSQLIKEHGLASR
ncbi:MAG: sigma 54-interacting transcriptional regulator, partial [Deltaproteobacteria bacterium]|nr:sigma 54-interacting transcriptional regulator [Deltaproteobacteria bacterium]